jgi:hypothetical protein
MNACIGVFVAPCMPEMSRSGFALAILSLPLTHGGVAQACERGSVDLIESRSEGFWESSSAVDVCCVPVAVFFAWA